MKKTVHAIAFILIIIFNFQTCSAAKNLWNSSRIWTNNARTNMIRNCFVNKFHGGRAISLWKKKCKYSIYRFFSVRAYITCKPRMVPLIFQKQIFGELNQSLCIKCIPNEVTATEKRLVCIPREVTRHSR